MIPNELCRDVIGVVARFFGLTPADLVGRRRLREFVTARYVAIYLIRDAHPSLSYLVIGRHFNRDHTTVMHAITTINTALRTDRSLAYEIEKLRRVLRTRATLQPYTERRLLPCQYIND